MLLQASQLPVGDRSFELPQRISKRMQEVWATQKPRDDLSYREFLFQGFLLTQFFSEQPFQVATATWIPVGYLIFWALAAANLKVRQAYNQTLDMAMVKARREVDEVSMQPKWSSFAGIGRRIIHHKR